MKVLDHQTGVSPVEPVETAAHTSLNGAHGSWMPPSLAVDITCCTRCSEPWTFDQIENVEIWSCASCGYEARERSSDYWRAIMARCDLPVG